MSIIHDLQGGFFVPKGYRNTIPSFIASLGVEWVRVGGQLSAKNRVYPKWIISRALITPYNRSR